MVALLVPFEKISSECYMITDPLTPHPYAACYPLVSGALEESLYESIKHNGLRQPIVLWRDHLRETVWLIDGRNRHRALCQLYGGIEETHVMWQSYESDEAVRLAVLDYNENRRQMSTAQKSVVAGRIIEARAQLLAPLNKGHQETQVEDAERLDDLSDDEPPFDLEDPPPSGSNEPQSIQRIASMSQGRDCPPEVRREVASTLGIGAKTAQRGAAVVGRGAPKLVSALEEGLVSVEAAYTLTQLDDEELESVVAQGKEVMKEKARALKGVELKAKEDAKRERVLGDVEVDQLHLSWTERSDEGAQHFNLQVTNAETLSALLMTLTKLGLRGVTETDAETDAETNPEH